MSKVNELEHKINILDRRACSAKKALTNLSVITEDIREALTGANDPSITNVFVTEEDLANIAIGTNIFVTNSFSTLPDATLNNGIFYWVENAQGTQWLPGSLGGTYYPKGLYYSNGITWNKTESPYQATQAEVNTGVNNNKFVTPLTLANADQWDTKANTSHTHAISDITDLQTELDGKLSSIPSEYITETELAAELGDYVLNTDSRLSDARIPLSHTHTASQVTDFDAEVSNNIDVAANTAARHTHSNQAILDATTAVYTNTKDTKLAGIQAGATINSSDAVLLARANHTGTQAISTVSNLQVELDNKQPLSTVLTNTTASFTLADETKLDGIQSGATANSTDAQLRDRSTHTGTQNISTVNGLQTALDGKSNTGHTHIIAEVTGLQGALDSKQPLSTVLTNTTASFVTADRTKLDGIQAGATANSSDATLLNRANHTGTQAINTVTGLQTALDGKQPLTTVLTNTTASFTTAQETKLSGIAAGAEVNVNADWNAVSGDAQILNKPTIPTTTSQLTNDSGFISSVTGDWTGTLDGQEGSYYLNRTNHTGSQAISTVTGLQTALDGKQPLSTILTNTTASFTTADETKLDGIESGADVTDSTNVDAAGAVMNSDYTPSHSVLVQQSGTGSPSTIQVSNNTLIGRLSGGGSNIAALSSSDVKTMLSLNNVQNADTTTTANITDSLNKRFVTDAQQTIINNTSGTNTGDNAVNSLYSGLAASKQDTLVSGTNIKTINGTTVLGSGDITISAGATNLTTTQSATNVVVNSDTGTDATIPLGNGTNAGVSLNDYTTAEKNKLSGIATGATANSSDAALLNRSNHTGTQLASTISDLQTAITNNTAVLANTAKNSYPTGDAAKVGFITITQAVNLDTIESDTVANNAKVSNATHTGDVTGSTALTITDNIVSNAKLSDMAVNTIKGRITAGTGDPEDLTAANIRTITETETTTQLNTRDTNNRNRSNHTGTQLSSTISDLQETVEDIIGTKVIAGTNVTISYNDTTGETTINSTGGGGTGDVVGPASSADEAIARFDGTTGKLLQNSTVKITDNGSLILPENSLPTPSEPGEMKLFTREVASRLMPAFMGPNGLDSILQPLLARNKIGYWNPPGNATTVPGVFGFTAPTVTGFTTRARNVTTTNLFTRMRRLGYETAATAGTVGHWRVAVAQYTVGSSVTELGGFTYIIRFGISDAAPVAGARMFIGMRNVVTPTNVEPSTITQGIGIGHGAANTNLSLYYGGTAAQTPINLGVNFPTNTLSVDVYELALFSAPNSGDVHWEVTRLNTGDVSTGTIVNSGATVLPTNTTLIGPWGYRTNNATALAVGLDVMSAYIETDY